ncbi:MAG TPA: chorismate mutase, partial [Mycobacterium sp.]|nr:chorismate mutase [Mycobacterium sp.]
MTVETEQMSDIDALRQEIDRLDAEILAAVKRRTEVSQEIGRARMASGGTR